MYANNKKTIKYIITQIIRNLMNILEDTDNYNNKTLNKLELLLYDINNLLNK